MNASLKQLDKPLFSCEYIFKREIRNEPVSMPLVNGPIFIQNFFFSDSAFIPLWTGEIVCIQNMMIFLVETQIFLGKKKLSVFFLYV